MSDCRRQPGRNPLDDHPVSSIDTGQSAHSGNGCGRCRSFGRREFTLEEECTMTLDFFARIRSETSRAAWTCSMGRDAEIDYQ